MKKKYVVIMLAVAVILVLSRGLTKSEQSHEKNNSDLPKNMVIQPGNGIASGVSMLDGAMPLRYAFSDDGRRLIAGAGERSAFYNIGQIKRVDLRFEQSEWWNMLTANYSSRTEIPASMIYDGTALQHNVGVRFKGNTSYSRNRTEKKSFAVSVDFENDS